jgi:hypothetical protein
MWTLGCFDRQIDAGMQNSISGSTVHYPIGRNRMCKSVHASLTSLERLRWEQARLDRAHHPAPRCGPERISVTGATKPLRAAPPLSMSEHPVAPETMFAAGLRRSSLDADTSTLDAKLVAAVLQDASPSLSKDRRYH